jgi:hypothetical protein
LRNSADEGIEVLGVASDANDLQPSRTGTLRRSQRVCLNVEVDVIVQRENIASDPERTFTLVVSAHGALLTLRADVAVGDALTLRNVKTNEEVACRVVDCGAKKVDTANVGIEFANPRANFWHVAFPPADWSPRSAEAKSYRPQVVKSPAIAKT